MTNYFEGISIENFRVFETETYFDFTQINILTGPNNSGKSSLIKFLLLLKENGSLFKSIIEGADDSKKQLDFDGVDSKLNSFETVVTNKKKPLVFKIKYEGIFFRFIIKSPGRIEHLINLCDEDNKEILSLEGNVLKVDFKLFGKYFHSTDSGIDAYEGQDPYGYGENVLAYERHMKYVDENFNRLRDFEKKQKDGIVSFDISKTPINLKQSSVYGNMANKDRGFDLIYTTFKHFIKFDLAIIDFFISLIHMTHHRSYFENIYYVSSVKKHQKRVYNSSDKDSLNQILNRIKEKDLKNVNVIKFTNKWIKEFELGEKILLKHDSKLGINYILIDDRPLIDFGYGYTQIISILLQVCEIIIERDTVLKTFNKLLILEEPESNLHPNFQSKLADLIVDIYHLDIYVIVETHSEYLIRKLQYLTAKKEINPEDSVIYYFHHPDNVPEGEDQIKELNIKEDGSLTGDFGPGFFDEATNLKFELLKLKNPQKN